MQCGELTLSRCPSCNAPLPGTAVGTVGIDYDPPQFCLSCGVSMPWISRQGLLWKLENILDAQGLDEEDHLVAHAQLEALRDWELSEEEQARCWEHIRTICPTLIDAGRSIILAVASEAQQQHLGLR
jgi:hypothetical protein